MTMRSYFTAGAIGLVTSVGLVWCLDYKNSDGFYRGVFPDVEQLSAESEELWKAHYRGPMLSANEQNQAQSQALLSKGFMLIFLQWLLNRALPFSFCGLLVGPLILYTWDRNKIAGKNGMRHATKSGCNQ